MNRHDEESLGRRSVMTGVGIAVAGLAAGATAACAQTGRSGSGFSPTRHAEDAWLDALPGGHRVFVDSATAGGGAAALLYANNLYDAQARAYDGGPGDFALVVCFRHFSTPFGYTDAVWSKYGEIFGSVMQLQDPVTAAAPRINLMNSSAYTSLPNMGVTIDAVTGRGTQIAICMAATTFIANAIANETGGDADAIRQELVDGAVDNSRFVSAGVMALTRSQEYGYSLLYAG
jgi:hypothetical protein